MHFIRNCIWNLLILISLVFQSCGSMSDDRFLELKVLNETLEHSSKSNQFHSYAIYKEFENKLSDPMSNVVAGRWKNKLYLTRETSTHLTKFIDSLKYVLQEASNISDVGLKEKKTVESIFNDQKLSDTLYNRILRYKETVLNADEEIQIIFKDEILLPKDEKNESINNKYFQSIYFDNKSIVEAVVNLSIFQNKIVVFESAIATFYNNKVTSHDNYYETYSAIIGQSSNYLRPGDSLTITAGVGLFSTISKPSIIIGETVVNTDINGVAVTSIQSSKKRGKHTVPVTIVFTKPNGIRDTNRYEIEYNVIAW